MFKSMKIVCLFVLLTYSFLFDALGQEPLRLNGPINASNTNVSSVPEEFKDLVWNKWDTENFIVLSISEQQGLYLKNNIEKIKSSLLKNWGMKNFNFSKKCKLICVPDKEMLNKLFKKQDFHLEVRKNSDGEIEDNIIWFYLDNINDMGEFNSSVLNICLSELSQKIQVTPKFCKIGMCSLSKNSNQVRKILLEAGDSKASDLIEGSNLSEGDAAILCLMIRKEYGQNNFLEYLFSGDLKSLGFNDLSQFDKTFDRYRFNLKNDLNNNTVPTNYLKIENSY